MRRLRFALLATLPALGTRFAARLHRLLSWLRHLDRQQPGIVCVPLLSLLMLPFLQTLTLLHVILAATLGVSVLAVGCYHLGRR